MQRSSPETGHKPSFRDVLVAGLPQETKTTGAESTDDTPSEAHTGPKHAQTGGELRGYTGSHLESSSDPAQPAPKADSDEHNIPNLTHSPPTSKTSTLHPTNALQLHLSEPSDGETFHGSPRNSMHDSIAAKAHDQDSLRSLQSGDTITNINDTVSTEHLILPVAPGCGVQGVVSEEAASKATETMVVEGVGGGAPTPTPALGEGSIPRPARTIRFRSRVRIASGFHGSSSSRHKRLSSSADGDPNRTERPSRPERGLKDDSDPTQPRPTSSSASFSSSSRSSSPSSSISAPLRTRSRTGSEDEGRRSSWAPLGRRIGLLAGQRPVSSGVGGGRRKRHFGDEVYSTENGGVLDDGSADADANQDERTFLLPKGRRSRRRPSYVEGEGVQPGDPDPDDEEEEELTAEEVDQVFGRWPGRLMNRHWWWWQLEPICCCCLTSERG